MPLWNSFEPLQVNSRSRVGLIDFIRGAALISMIVYHGCYDLSYIFEPSLDWFESPLCELWQQSILWTFVLISGISCHFGKRQIKRGAVVLGAGVLVSVATYLFFCSEWIIFGVLNLIGTAMILFGLGRRFWFRLAPWPAFVVCLLLFTVTYELPTGFLGVASTPLWPLPKILYDSNVLFVFGFCQASFSGIDYVPLLPWFFLYLAGFYSWFLLRDIPLVVCCSTFCWRPVNWLGRHSLLVYLLHQPILLAILFVICKMI